MADLRKHELSIGAMLVASLKRCLSTGERIKVIRVDNGGGVAVRETGSISITYAGREPELIQHSHEGSDEYRNPDDERESRKNFVMKPPSVIFHKLQLFVPRPHIINRVYVCATAEDIARAQCELALEQKVEMEKLHDVDAVKTLIDFLKEIWECADEHVLSRRLCEEFHPCFLFRENRITPRIFEILKTGKIQYYEYSLIPIASILKKLILEMPDPKSRLAIFHRAKREYKKVWKETEKRFLAATVEGLVGTGKTSERAREQAIADLMVFQLERRGMINSGRKIFELVGIDQSMVILNWLRKANKKVGFALHFFFRGIGNVTEFDRFSGDRYDIKLGLKSLGLKPPKSIPLYSFVKTVQAIQASWDG